MYTHEIYVSGAWVEITPINEDQSIIRRRFEGQYFARDEFKGTIVLRGSEYDLVKTQSETLNNIDYRLKLDGTVIYSGYFNLFGQFDDFEHVGQFTVETNDEYSKIITNYDKEINIYSDPNLVKVSFALADRNLIYTRNIELKETLKYLINSADDSILFDNDSFDLFDTFDNNWSNIFIAGMSDVILESGVEKTDPQTIGELSLSKLFELFREIFHSYWSLEKIGSDYYFRLKHISQISFGTLAQDPYILTDYKSRNWTTAKESFEYKKDNRFSVIQRTLVAGNIDFIGRDISIPKFANIGNVKKIDVNSFYFDITDTVDNPSRYSNLSTSQFMLVQTTYVRFATEDQTITGIIEPTERGYDFLNVAKAVYDNFTSVFNDGNFTASHTPIGSSVHYPDDYLGIPYIKFELDGFDLVAQYWSYRVDLTVTGLDENTTAYLLFTYFESVYDDIIVPITNGNFSTIISNNVFFQEEFYILKYLIIEGTPLTPFNVTINRVNANWFEAEYNVPDLGKVISSINKYNYRLSLAYIDAVAGKYELPDTTAVINGVEVGVQKKKDRVLNDIQFPLTDQTEVDFNYNFTTDAGEVEPVELEVKLDGSPATMKGEF